MINKGYIMLSQALKWIKINCLILFKLLEKYFLFVKSIFLNSKSVKAIGIILGFLFLIILIPNLFQRAIISFSTHHPNNFITDSVSYEKTRADLANEIKKLEKKLDYFTPKSYYIIINSTQNEFSLMKGKQLIRNGKCSTGSYLLLEGGTDQKWLFKTPKGELRVRGKKTSPVWKKPDWAFVEEGLPVPSANHKSRFEYGVLGDYALVLGEGYMIHGTLYQRFLGLPVTHGCVRLNDVDLKKVYQSMEVGSKVYVY